MLEAINFTSPKQLFLYNLLLEKDRILFDHYLSLRRLLPINLSPGKIITRAMKLIKEGKQLTFANKEINKIIPEIIRNKQVVDSLSVILEEEGMERSFFSSQLLSLLILQ